MIELHYAATPNAWKVSIFLQEAGLPYELKLIDIRKGEQFDPAFLRIAPNNRIPAIIDLDPADGGAPISIFESGAILEYLGDKTGQFFPTDVRQRAEVRQWLFWQMAGLGPMVGQANHFLHYAAEPVPSAAERYVNEVGRLHAVLDRRLADRQYVAGDEYTIADMAIYPWTAGGARQKQDFDKTPNLKRWLADIARRPAVKRALAEGEKHSLARPLTDEEKKIMHGQTAAVVTKQP